MPDLPGEETKYTSLSTRPFVEESLNQILIAAAKNDRFIDDITGQPLSPELCREARRVEVNYFRSKGVWSSDRFSGHCDAPSDGLSQFVVSK